MSEKRYQRNVIIAAIFFTVITALLWQTQRSLVSIGAVEPQAFFANDEIPRESKDQFAFAGPTGLLRGTSRNGRPGTAGGAGPVGVGLANALPSGPADSDTGVLPPNELATAPSSAGSDTAGIGLSGTPGNTGGAGLPPTGFSYLPLTPGGTIGSPPISSVPEPQVWTMLILGFFVAGWSMRRRRAQALFS